MSQTIRHLELVQPPAYPPEVTARRGEITTGEEALAMNPDVLGGLKIEELESAARVRPNKIEATIAVSAAVDGPKLAAAPKAGASQDATIVTSGTGLDIAAIRQQIKDQPAGPRVDLEAAA